MLDVPKLLEKLPTKISKDLSITECTRKGQRRKILDAWFEEEEHSRYRYNVETCKDGRKVYLLRPTWKNRGLDFQINLEGFKSKCQEAPKHDDLTGDLKEKKAESPDHYQILRKAIDDVYGCEEPDDVLIKCPDLTFNSGLPMDSILKLLKWLFIEQDLTYWNHSGRRMFMEGIKEMD
jgi:hypothetical protein